MKHRNGTHAILTLREHPALFQLAVEDNGTDILIKNDGMGLQNMNIVIVDDDLLVPESLKIILEAVASKQTVFGDEAISKIPSLLHTTTSFDYATKDINERELEELRDRTQVAVFYYRHR